MPSAAPFEAIIRHRTAHLNFLLNLQSGDVYYMNIIRLSQQDLSLLDRYFPLKAPAIIRLGLSVGSLLNYPLADHDHNDKINTFLQYLVNILYESPLVDDLALENAILSMENEYAALRDQQQQYNKQQQTVSPLSPFSPTEKSGATNNNNNNGQYNDSTPPNKLRRPRAAKSIGDLDKLKNLHIDTRLAQQVIKAPTMPAATATATGSNNKNKSSRAGSPITATNTAIARSPASPSFNNGDASAKVIRKTASSNRLASKLRKMKSSNSLWGHHSSAAYHSSSPVSEKFSKSENNLNKNNANCNGSGGANSASKISDSSAAAAAAAAAVGTAAAAADQLAITNIHKQFSQQNYPINITLDNLYSLSNLLKILIRIFDKISDFINKQKQSRLSILQSKAVANNNRNYRNNDNTSQSVGQLADASQLQQPKQQTNYSPSSTSNVSHKNSINNNNIILDDYQPPSKRFPSSYSSSSLVSHSSSSLSASSMIDAASTSASLGVPYNGPISSPSPTAAAATTMKTASSSYNSNTNQKYHNELAVPLTPYSSHSASTAPANSINTLPRSNSNFKNNFPQLSSLSRTTTDKASLAGTEITEQSSTSGYSIGDTTAATVVTGGTGPYISIHGNNASSNNNNNNNNNNRNHSTATNNCSADGHPTSTSITNAPASKDTEEEFINDLASVGFNDTTLQLLEKIDAKIQTDLFEPVFEVLDLICENCVNREINELVGLLSGDDDLF